MRRREVLLGGSAVLFAACTRTPSETPLPPAYAPIQQAVTQAIKPEQLPGAVWLVARGDDIVAQASGVRAVGTTDPMQRDTIFRIASMTKVITAACVLMLVEEGKVSLDENVDRLLPELTNRRVLRTPQSQLDDTVPATRPIQIKQLLDFTFGFAMSMDPSLPIVKAADQQQLTLGMPIPMTPHAPDEWMRRFGTLPLTSQPGERWGYNVGSLIQGVLIKRASGKDFDTFVEERITGPLGMHDTGFYVPATKLNRFAGCGAFTNAETQQTTRMDQDGAQSAYAARPIFPSGAGGLCSTVDDYLVFTRLLRAGGQHNGRRVLSSDSVRLITTNQLTEAQIAATAAANPLGFFGPSNGWGYGVAVQQAADANTQTPGTYGWDGGFGSTFFTDPNRDVTAIAMTQSADFLFGGGKDAFRAAVYQSTAS